MNKHLFAPVAALLLLAACATGPVSSGLAPGVKPYPLKTCLVTDNDLDSMGEQASFVYQGQTIKVCCKACIAKFEKNPAKYLKKLEGKLSSADLIKTYVAADKQLITDAVTLSIFQHPAVTAYNSALKNVKPAPLTPNLVWNYWEWTY